MGIVLIAIRTGRTLVVAVAVAVAAAGCSAGSSAAHEADTITKAVYAGDYDATVADFDPATKQSVTRAQVGALSDRMHELGAFTALTERTAPLGPGKYEFDATFERGKMLVEMRLDASGKVAAYRVAKL